MGEREYLIGAVFYLLVSPIVYFSLGFYAGFEFGNLQLKVEAQESKLKADAAELELKNVKSKVPS